ncbi:CdaR family transcriptional regulator [Amycolatopsis sp. GM8]|uniref:PucR family transcriptional regulator n=1 Tax=Amycolatopsis sp. GM8 TaxID=2896530 RepID=UPI001F293D0D|nr:helix-turn-helix domain-containing protein [Amycolatopsis sp. GM8]
MDVGEVVARSVTLLAATSSGAAGTLRDLLENLGPHALRLVTGTEPQLQRPAGEPVVYGPDEPIHDVAGAVVLLTGGRSDPAEIAGRIRQSAAARASAVVVKAWGKDLGLAAAAARESGIALLCTPDEMAWRHLDAFVTAASAARVAIAEDAGSTGDLFGLANAIAASLGGPVTIEEIDGRILAYSNLPDQEIDEIRRLAILGRRTPERPSNAAEYQAVITSQGPVLFESAHPEYADRLAVAVRAGHQVLGVIFVLVDRPKLVDDADRALVDAARSVALHLLRAKDSISPERERRSEALRGLLASSLDPASAAAALSVPAGVSFVLAMVRPAGASRLRATDAARVADLITLHGEYWHPESATVLEAGDVVLLLPVLDPPADQRGEGRLAARLRRLGTDLVTAARRSAKVDLVIGFGAVVDDLATVPDSRRLTARVVDTLLDPRADVPSDGVATLHDVRSQVVLACLRSGAPIDDDVLRLPAVRAVLEHDAGQGTDYARTLLAYLGSAGSITATAEALNIHDNTARYRVRRLTEMFGVALDAGDETLVTWLQLRNALRGPRG